MTESPLDDARAIVADCIRRDACGNQSDPWIARLGYERVARIEFSAPAKAPPVVWARHVRRVIAVSLCLTCVVALVVWCIAI